MGKEAKLIKDDNFDIDIDNQSFERLEKEYV